jgi:hypothetical protein
MDIIMMPRWLGTPPSPFTSGEPHNFWEQEDTGQFVHGNNTVEFGSSAVSGHTYAIRGDTTWWVLACHEDSATLKFSNYAAGTLGHRVDGELLIEPSSKSTASLIILEREFDTPNTSVIHPSPPPSPTDHFWLFIMGTQANMNIGYVRISNCFSGQPVIRPPNVFVLPYNTYRNVGWFDKNSFFFAYTEDSTHTGKIDRIRLQSAFDLAPLNLVNDNNNDKLKITLSDAFTGKSYTDAITYFRRVQEDFPLNSFDRDSIYIFLNEDKMPYDTGIKIYWEITVNDAVFDLVTGKIKIGNPQDSGYTVDTAPPRITNALAVPGHNEIYFQVSEDISDTSGLSVDVPVLGLSGLIPRQLNKKEFLVSLGNASFNLAHLTAGDVFVLNGLTDSAVPAQDLKTPAVSGLDFYLFPSPKYPQNYNYDDANGGIGSYVFQPYVTVADNPPVAPPGVDVVLPQNKGYELSSGKTVDLDSSVKVEHRVADIFISVPPGNLSDFSQQEQFFIWPLWAKYSNVPARDGELGESLSASYGYMGPGGGDRSFADTDIIWDFTGKRFLELNDVILQSKISDALSLGGPYELVYAFNVPGGRKSTNDNTSPGLWNPGISLPKINPPYVNLLPGLLSGYSTVAMNGVGPGLYNYEFEKTGYPGDSANHTIEFYYFFGGIHDILAGRLDMAAGAPIPADWYCRIRPFSFGLHDVTRQRGNVTILNNVINSEKRERVFLDYKLNKSGRVTIQVFTLDGNLVKVLVRENQNQTAAY